LRWWRWRALFFDVHWTFANRRNRTAQHVDRTGRQLDARRNIDHGRTARCRGGRHCNRRSTCAGRATGTRRPRATRRTRRTSHTSRHRHARQSLRYAHDWLASGRNRTVGRGRRRLTSRRWRLRSRWRRRPVVAQQIFLGHDRQILRRRTRRRRHQLGIVVLCRLRVTDARSGSCMRGRRRLRADGGRRNVHALWTRSSRRRSCGRSRATRRCRIGSGRRTDGGRRTLRGTSRSSRGAQRSSTGSRHTAGKDVHSANEAFSSRRRRLCRLFARRRRRRSRVVCRRARVAFDRAR
jgi:hypothetical protein